MSVNFKFYCDGYYQGKRVTGLRKNYELSLFEAIKPTDTDWEIVNGFNYLIPEDCNAKKFLDYDIDDMQTIPICNNNGSAGYGKGPINPQSQLYDYLLRTVTEGIDFWNYFYFNSAGNIDTLRFYQDDPEKYFEITKNRYNNNTVINTNLGEITMPWGMQTATYNGKSYRAQFILSVYGVENGELKPDSQFFNSIFINTSIATPESGGAWFISQKPIGYFIKDFNISENNRKLLDLFNQFSTKWKADDSKDIKSGVINFKKLGIIYDNKTGRVENNFTIPLLKNKRFTTPDTTQGVNIGYSISNEFYGSAVKTDMIDYLIDNPDDFKIFYKKDFDNNTVYPEYGGRYYEGDDYFKATSGDYYDFNFTAFRLGNWVKGAIDKDQASPKKFAKLFMNMKMRPNYVNDRYLWQFLMPVASYIEYDDGKIGEYSEFYYMAWQRLKRTDMVYFDDIELLYCPKYETDYDSVVQTHMSGYNINTLRQQCVRTSLSPINVIKLYMTGIEFDGGSTQKPNPIDPDGPSGPGGSTDPGGSGGGSEDGGGGNHDWESDDITKPSIPTGVLASNLYKLYSPDLTQMQNFSKWLYVTSTDEFWANIQKRLNNPLSFINNLKIFPIAPIKDGVKSVYIFGKDSGVNLPPVLDQYMEVNLGTLRIERFWNTFMDYSPYTKMNLYLPFYGSIDIDPEQVYGKDITVRYRVDFLTGAGVIYVDIDNNSVFQFSTKLGYEVPLSSAYVDYVGMYTAALSGSITQPFQFINNMMEASKPVIQQTGNMEPSHGFMGVNYPYLKIERPRTNIPETYGSDIGYTCNMSRYLNEVKGFTIVDSIHLDGVQATDQELSEIMNILKEGVII